MHHEKVIAKRMRKEQALKTHQAPVNTMHPELEHFNGST
jgi:hypothetical protein